MFTVIVDGSWCTVHMNHMHISFTSTVSSALYADCVLMSRIIIGCAMGNLGVCAKREVVSLRPPRCLTPTLTA